MLELTKRIAVLVLMLLVTGCAGLRPPPAMEYAQDAVDVSKLPGGEGWWYARFTIHRPDNKPPRWHMGTLLAGEVIAPMFERHYRDILVWRIHRRAGNDASGHVFSFIFYATAAGAKAIYSDIASNPVLSMLEQKGWVTQVKFDDLHKIIRPGIEDTSDTHWTPLVQKTWPAMIMGASRMWLDMVSVLAADKTPGEDLETHYKAVHDEVTQIWAEQGQHALLHHLSAIYAYEPLMIKY